MFNYYSCERIIIEKNNIKLSLKHQQDFISFFHIEYGVNNVKFTTEDDENVSKFIYKVIAVLNKLEIPYNIVFSKGNTYIYPRIHENDTVSKTIAFIEFCGIIVFEHIGLLNAFNTDQFLYEFKQIKLSEKVFDNIVKEIGKGGDDI